MTEFRDGAVKALGALGVCALAAATVGAWFVFAVCCWAFLGVAFLIGVAPASRRAATRWVVLIGLVHVGLLVAMTLVGPEERFLGLPAGWALLVFGIWTAGIVPNLFFSRIFDRWVLTPEAIDRVLATKRR
ncbi:MAG: hypothetical protein O2795_08030 [Acidobacteria bacterium]|nr:hypothetical protein [Acidobacteriota bacterium]